MSHSLIASIAALGLIGTSAFAQDDTMQGMTPDMSVLPQVCRNALEDAKTPVMTEGRGMMKMMEGMDSGGRPSRGREGLPALGAVCNEIWTIFVLYNADRLACYFFRVEKSGTISQSDLSLKQGNGAPATSI